MANLAALLQASRVMPTADGTIAHAILARHGSTASNKGGVGKDFIRGHSDVPLNDKGRQDAQELAAELKVNEFPIVLIFTSPFSRTLETAQILAQTFGGCQIIKSDGLTSWNLGPHIEGKIVNPRMVKAIKRLVSTDEVPPGGESFSTYVRRYTSTLVKLLEMIAAKEAKNTNVAIVTHARGMQLADLWFKAGNDVER
jgi:broad specificity phosphatase PhoE